MNKFCMKCGSKIDQTTGLCPQCSPQDITKKNIVQDGQKKSKKNTLLLVAVAVVVSIVIFSIINGIATSSDIDKDTDGISNSSKQEEIKTTEPETYVTSLTEEQLKSFEKLLNGMPRSLDAMEDHFNRTDAVVGTFICSSFWNQPKETMFDYYFSNDYKIIQNDNEGYSVTYEFDAEKVLFILNDVFELDVTKELSRAKYYFKENKFYYSTEVYGMGYETITYSVDSYEYTTDGYFKIKTNYKHTDYDGNVNKGDDRYYIVKPDKHQEYGDYWKFREIGFEDNVIWTNDASYKDDTIGWKKPLIDTVSDFRMRDANGEDAKYYLFDMEKDGVPEVLAEYETRYGGKKLKLFYFNGKTYESNEFSSDVFYYVPGGKNILISYKESGMNYDDVFAIKNGDLTKVATGKYLDELVPGYGSEYFWGKVKVSQEEYNKKLNSYLNTQKKVSYKNGQSYDFEKLYSAISDYPV